ncbi:right-handed parallel beta-helix repeat-containing protein [Hansschlegelia sp. KR7-227]|uniref:right-handed parallel beta-helix repeat-containing protein n=1 Tax=Hansschlegelia sp. KR7-227 TaxID=3400914 RepID=UPI003C03497F
MPAATQLNAVDFGFTPGAPNPSAALTSAIAAAITQGKPLFIEPGVYTVGNVLIDGRLEMTGVSGRVTLKMATGSNAILRALDAGDVLIRGITFDGGGLTPVDAYGVGYRALVVAQRTTSVNFTIRFETCDFRQASADEAHPAQGGYGLGASKCSLYVTNCEFTELFAAVGASDHDGFAFQGNKVLNMANNGVVTSRASGVPSFTRVSANRFAAVGRTQLDSTGWQGNAIYISQESNVLVAQNEIYNCAFSSIRLNGCARSRVAQNHCDKHGEVAIYVEGFSDGRQVANDGFDVVVSDNVVNDAGVGIAVGNINVGGRLSVIANNVIRRISRRNVAVGTTAEYTSPGRGVSTETCTIVANNFIEDAFEGVNVNGGSDTADSVVIGNVIRVTTRAMGVGGASGGKDVLVADNLAAGTGALGAGGGALRQLTAAGAVTGSTELASFTENTATANLRIEGVVKRQTL